MDATIKAGFWSDAEVSELPAEVKLAFFWLVTNSERSLCGVTPKNARRFAFDTNLEPTWLDRTLTAMEGKVVAVRGLIWVRSFMRHQFGDRLMNRADKLVLRLAQEVGKLPEDLREQVLSEYPVLAIGVNGVSKGHGRGMHEASRGHGRGIEGVSKGLTGAAGHNRLEVLPNQSFADDAASGTREGVSIPLGYPMQGTRAEQSRAEQSQVQGVQGEAESEVGDFPRSAEELMREHPTMGLSLEVANRFLAWVAERGAYDEHSTVLKRRKTLGTFVAKERAKQSVAKTAAPAMTDRAALEAERRSLMARLQNFAVGTPEHSKICERLDAVEGVLR